MAPNNSFLNFKIGFVNDIYNCFVHERKQFSLKRLMKVPLIETSLKKMTLVFSIQIEKNNNKYNKILFL